MPKSEAWALHRTDAASAHLARLEARREVEHRCAEAMLWDFAQAARRSGVPAEALRVRGYNASRSVRSSLRGWYLRQDRKAAVDTDGNFYLLFSPLTVIDRLRGLTPPPVRPPLVLGAGGRDGDSIRLEDALERLLPGWRESCED